MPVVMPIFKIFLPNTRQVVTDFIFSPQPPLFAVRQLHAPGGIASRGLEEWGEWGLGSNPELALKGALSTPNIDTELLVVGEV